MAKTITRTTNLRQGGPVLSKSAIYSKLAAHADEAIKELIIILKTSKNESLKFGAIKLILDKCIGDAKMDETEVRELLMEMKEEMALFRDQIKSSNYNS